jgi:hypothetical protein
MPETNQANGADAPMMTDDIKKLVAKATENARAKNARLKLMKERNELYRAARRAELDDDEDYDDDVTREL